MQIFGKLAFINFFTLDLFKDVHSSCLKNNSKLEAAHVTVNETLKKNYDTLLSDKKEQT